MIKPGSTQAKEGAWEEFKENMDIKYFHCFPYPHYRAPHAWWWEKKVRIIDVLGWVFFTVLMSAGFIVTILRPIFGWWE